MTDHSAATKSFSRTVWIPEPLVFFQDIHVAYFYFSTVKMSKKGN